MLPTLLQSSTTQYKMPLFRMTSIGQEAELSKLEGSMSRS